MSALNSEGQTKQTHNKINKFHTIKMLMIQTEASS